MKLYYSPGACSLAPHVALREAEAEFEAVRRPIIEGKTRTAEHLALDPRGFVPVLEVEGRVLTEVIALLTFIGNHYPEARLLPADPLALAGCYQRMSYLATAVHIAFAQVFRPERFTDDISFYEQVTAAGRERVIRRFDEIEAMLSGSTWFAGESFTAADVHLLPFFRWGRRINLPMDYPAWAEFNRRMLERPAVQAAIAEEGLAPSEW